jgi:hypothetical protein
MAALYTRVSGSIDKTLFVNTLNDLELGELPTVRTIGAKLRKHLAHT